MILLAIALLVFGGSLIITAKKTEPEDVSGIAIGTAIASIGLGLLVFGG